jgi:hypothetical protein
VFARVRERALRGEKRLAYFEYAAAESLTDLDPDDRDGWYAANPALGVRISEEFVEAEQRAMDPKTFAVERLGVGDWPSTTADEKDRISAEQWRACLDRDAKPDRVEVLSFDVAPDRSRASIVAASAVDEDRRFVKVLAHGAGTGWVIQTLTDLVDKHRPAAVLVDERSPAAALITGVENAGVDLERVNGTEYAGACAVFYDSAVQQTVLHDGDPELTAAVRGAGRRTLGDAWAWSRKGSSVDITALVAATLALRGVDRELESVYESRGVLAITLD